MTNPFEIIEKRLFTIENLLNDIKNRDLISPDFLKEKYGETEPEQKFDIKGLAKYLNCSVQTIHNLKKDGQLSYYRLNRKLYFKKAEIDKIARVQGIKMKGEKLK